MSFDSVFKKAWGLGKKLDPGTHKVIEEVVRNDSKLVKASARSTSKVLGGEDSWLGRRFNDLGDEADYNTKDPVRGVGRAAATVGVLYGGYAAMGAGGGAGAAAEGSAMGTGSGTLGAVDSATVGGAATTSGVPTSVNLVNAGGTQATGWSASGAAPSAKGYDYQRLMRQQGQRGNVGQQQNNDAQVASLKAQADAIRQQIAALKSRLAQQAP